METNIAVQSVVITVPEDIVGIRQAWLQTKQTELTMAREALGRLRESGATERRIQRTQERISLLRRCVEALAKGFVPMPRFDSQKLTLDMDELPMKAIVALDEAKAQKIFDEFRIVLGREGQSRKGPYGRIPQRDPIIIGVVRTPEHSHKEVYGEKQQFSSQVTDVLGMEEHFLIAWWRPDDQWTQDSF